LALPPGVNAMLALPSPGVATRLAGAAAQPVNVAAQSSDAQTPVSTVAQRREEEPAAKFIITDPRSQATLVCQESVEATDVARQQMT